MPLRIVQPVDGGKFYWDGALRSSPPTFPDPNDLRAVAANRSTGIEIVCHDTTELYRAWPSEPPWAARIVGLNLMFGNASIIELARTKLDHDSIVELAALEHRVDAHTKAAEAAGYTDLFCQTRYLPPALLDELLRARESTVRKLYYSAAEGQRVKARIMSPAAVVLGTGGGFKVMWDRTMKNDEHSTRMLEARGGDLEIIPAYDIIGVRTGRLRAMPGTFNFMGIPHTGPSRSMVVPLKQGNEVWAYDFNAIDFRSLSSWIPDLAILYKDANDFHARTFELLFPSGDLTDQLRRAVKGLFFTRAYGGGASAVEHALGVNHASSAMLIKRFDDVLPSIAEFRTTFAASSRVSSMIKTPWHDIAIDADEHDGAILGLLAQTTSAAAVKRAVCGVPAVGDRRVSLMFIVHDEIVVEGPKGDIELFEAVGRSIVEHASAGVGVTYTVKGRRGPSYGELT